MSKQFTLAKISPLGDRDDKYGQAFWGEVNEQLEPVKFNLMQGEPKAGDTITCEEVLLKTSSKGNDYHQLKKVRISQGGQDISETPQAIRNLQAAPSPEYAPRDRAHLGILSESKIEQLLELVKENNEMLKTLTTPGPHFDSSGAPDFIPDETGDY